MSLFKSKSVDEYGIVNYNPFYPLIKCLLFIYLVLIFGGGSVLYFIEVDVEGAKVHNLIECVWLANMAVSTVGFGDYYPITLPGMAIVSAISTMGISMFSAVGAFFGLAAFSKYNTGVMNRELKAQNDRNEQLNMLIVKTNQDAIDGNTAIEAKLDRFLSEFYASKS